MIKRNTALLAIGATICILLGYWIFLGLMQRPSLKDVEFELSVTKNVVDATHVNLQVTIIMNNPNTVDVTLDHIDYQFDGRDVTVLQYTDLGDYTIKQTFNLTAGGRDRVSAVIGISFDSPAKEFWTAILMGYVKWRIKGNAYFNTPQGPLDVQFECTQ
jgi:hypothetical protein